MAPQEVEGGGDGCGEGVPFGMCFEAWDLGRREREDREWPTGFWPGLGDWGAAQAAWHPEPPVCLVSRRR